MKERDRIAQDHYGELYDDLCWRRRKVVDDVIALKGDE